MTSCLPLPEAPSDQPQAGAICSAQVHLALCRDPSAWQSRLLPFACALSGTAAQKLEAVLGASRDSSGLWLHLIGSWGFGPLAALRSPTLFTRARAAMRSVKVSGVWGYSLAASIMLAQNRGCLCRGSSSGPLSL